MTYFNSEGEPLMTAAQARFEADLDAQAMYDALANLRSGRFESHGNLDRNEPDEYADPETCDHGDVNFSGIISNGEMAGRRAWCTMCDSETTNVTMDEDGWLHANW